jgi:hypothetical protein
MAFTQAQLIAKAMRDNPEKYGAEIEALYRDPKTAYLNPKHTGSFIGRKGNQGYAYWDSDKGEYVKVKSPNGSWERKNNRLFRDSSGEEGLDMIWYTNRHGDMVRGTRPEQSYKKDMGNGLGSKRIEGIDPDWQPSIQPDRNGMGDDGSTRRPDNVDDWQGSGTHDIDGNPIPGSQGDPSSNPNLDQNGGGGNNSNNGGAYYAGNGNTSWDWGDFESNLPQASEFAPPYTPDYTLGEESPWGNSGVEGGNDEFYRTQFNNLNRQNQAQQTQAIAAAVRRQFANQNPAEPAPIDWSWANNGQGLPEVVMAGGTIDNPTAPSVQEWITPGETTNYEIATRYGGDFANKDYAGQSFEQKLNSWMNPNNPGNYDWNVDTNWSKGLSAQGLVNKLPGDLVSDNVEFLSDIYNSMFDEYGVNTPEGGGATAKPGYALPVGVYPSGNSNE